MKSMKISWDVTAKAFGRMSGRSVGKERVERVDIDNCLFKTCILPLDVKVAYERFWNELNPLSEHVVFVSQITKI